MDIDAECTSSEARLSLPSRVEGGVASSEGEEGGVEGGVESSQQRMEGVQSSEGGVESSEQQGVVAQTSEEGGEEGEANHWDGLPKQGRNFQEYRIFNFLVIILENFNLY